MPQQPIIEIRQATDADIPAIAHIINEAWKAAYVGIVPQRYLDTIREEDKTKRLREGLIRVSHMRYFVLCENGSTVGAASLHRARNDDMPDAAEFSFFYFLPAVWRRGYGTMLLDFLKRESANAGFLRICCWVLEENHRAVSFYESHGLLRDGTRQTETIVIPLEEVRCVGRLKKEADTSKD
ncbi:MAG: GNAT family N-acetyltransferase [Eubacteriales bacterium]|jgi:ribosomal protein S18 acetylase RimI-like enzyme|nr:GNAT family N-acetyltransferase [Eubacteriales bacterium]